MLDHADFHVPHMSVPAVIPVCQQDNRGHANGEDISQDNHDVVYARLTLEPHFRVESNSNADSDQNDEDDIDDEQSISSRYRVYVVGRWPVCEDTQWYRSHCEGGRDAGVGACAAMVTTILMEVGEGESPSRKQGAAQMLVAVFTAECLLWSIGSSRPMGDESGEPGGE